RHTRFSRDWSSDVCSSDLMLAQALERRRVTVVGHDARARLLHEIAAHRLAHDAESDEAELRRFRRHPGVLLLGFSASRNVDRLRLLVQAHAADALLAAESAFLEEIGRA